MSLGQSRGRILFVGAADEDVDVDVDVEILLVVVVVVMGGVSLSAPLVAA